MSKLKKLEKMLYNADPSANSTNKDAVVERVILHVGDRTIPQKITCNWMRPAIAAACVCLLLVGFMTTGAAQTVVEYVRDLFVTVEIVAVEDVTGRIGFGQWEFVDDIIEEVERVPIIREKITLEAARNISSFRLPEKLPRGLEFTGAEKDYVGKNLYGIYFQAMNDYNSLSWSVVVNEAMLIVFYTDEENVYKYTVDGIVVYFSELDGLKRYSFIDRGHMHIIMYDGGEEPLTDEEIVEMIGSMR
jgi:hypothetical protein